LRNGDSYGGNIKLRLLANIVRRLKLKIRKQPELEGQKLLISEETIDNLLARDSGDQEEVEEFIGSALEERIEDIEALNETLRGRN
jgi:hypothetical protein